MLNLRTIDQHAGHLTDLIIHGFDYLTDHDDWYQVVAHLNMAAGIKHIEYDRLRFDRYYNIGMGCDAADDSSYFQNNFENKLIISLCRFNFIWSALETIIDLSVPPKLISNPRGKINNTCYFLKHNIPPKLSFKAYEETLELLENTINEDSDYSKIIKDGSLYGDHVSLSGKGIFLAYKLRNKLVHGSLTIPDAQEDDKENIDNHIIKLSSRVVLYTIQMLTIIFWIDKYPTIRWDVDIDIEEIDIVTAFTNIQYDIDFSELPSQKNIF